MTRLAAALPTEIAASAAILATFAVLNVVAPSVQAQTPNLPPRSGGTSYVGDEAQGRLGGQTLAPANLAPAKESLQGTMPVRPAQGPAIVVPQASCGTYWTGWVKDPNADVDPCPKGCERGKRLRLDEHKSGEATEYQANYECYLPKLEVVQPVLKARAAGAGPRKNCGTVWTGWQSDPNSAVNPCPANCERGELRRVNRSLTNGKLAYDMNYQCYVKGPEASNLAAPQPAPEPWRGIKKTPRAAFRPQVITTEAMQLTGLRRPPFVPVTVTTDAMQLTGLRRPPFVPVTITTQPMQLSGTRLHRVELKTDRQVELPPPSVVAPVKPR